MKTNWLMVATIAVASWTTTAAASDEAPKSEQDEEPPPVGNSKWPSYPAGPFEPVGE
ncbi:MAG: hypothetical protein AAGE52_00225 [Myxococcota bacterium]